MSTKSKWDQPSPSSETDKNQNAETTNDKLNGNNQTLEGGKTASEAAAAAAAIAAKIAAQFSSGALKDEAAFQKDVDINDVRNRYMLTKGGTQQQIHEETGASISTKGIWYPDRKALNKALARVDELIHADLGPLVEDKKNARDKRRWPEEKMVIGLENIRNFNIRAKVVGPSGSFVKYIQQETGTRVQIKGLGSGFIEQETGRESEEPLYIHITGPDEGQVHRAKVLTEDLLVVVRQEHAKMQALLQQQQMELQQVQAQYAAYSAMAAGYAPPPPTNAPPPPPGEQPPAPGPDSTTTPAGIYNPAQTVMAQNGAPAAASDQAGQDAFTAYWAAYGYDVNSPQFKEWAAQQQYSQYYANVGATAGGAAPPPSGDAPPPPPA